MIEPRIIYLLEKKARDNATKTGTGICQRGAVTVRFYPVCQRHSYWLNGEGANKKDVVEWLAKKTR